MIDAHSICSPRSHGAHEGNTENCLHFFVKLCALCDAVVKFHATKIKRLPICCEATRKFKDTVFDSFEIPFIKIMLSGILGEKDNFFIFIIVLAKTTNYFSKCLKYCRSYSIRILKSRSY